MQRDDLSDDLVGLARDLASRPRPAPSGNLRQRVLAAVRSELARPAPAPRRRLGTWEFAAAVAAAVLFLMNLSMVVASGARLDLGGPPSNGTEAAVASLQRLLPDLPEREVRRQVVLLKAASCVVPAPNVKPSAGQWLANRDRGARAIRADLP